MIELILKRKGIYCYFSNPKKESENELLHDKIAATKSLLGLVSDNVISGKNGLDLLNQVIDLRDFPVATKKRKRHEDFLEADMSGLQFIFRARLALKIIESRENVKVLPALSLCPNCSSHGTIITTDCHSPEFCTKIEARETLNEMHLLGKVDKKEKEKLLQDINESSLPETDIEKCKEMN